MNGLWDCEKLDELIFRIIRANIDSEVARDFRAIVYFLKSKFLNQQSANKVHEVARKHYDIGNDLFAAMLDKRMDKVLEMESARITGRQNRVLK